MEPIYTQHFTVSDAAVDRFCRLKPSTLLYYAQEVAGQHCTALSLSYEALAERRLFWAVIRQRVRVNRMPQLGEDIRVETWPMPTTRVAFPRSTVAYDAEGNECFRAIGLWVLMNLDTRSMILPGKSGICLAGTVRGTELPAPNSLVPRALASSTARNVCFTDLDRNGHMNNTRYMDWIDDLLPSAFHSAHTPREFTVCYLSEAKEGQKLRIGYELTDDLVLQVNAERQSDDASGKSERVFAASVLY